MTKLILFILLGLLFAVPGEILNQILARNDPRAFGITMISYSVLLLIGFFVSKGISAAFPNSAAKSRLVHYLLFGFLGLMVEWCLLGNTPVLDPLQLITQPGMFTYWGTMLLAPCLMLEPGLAGLKRSFAKFFTGISLLYLLVAIIVPRARGGIFFGFILFAAGSTALNYFYIQYFRRLAELHKNPGTPSGVCPHG